MRTEIDIENQTGEVLPEWLSKLIETAKAAQQPVKPNRHQRRFMKREQLHKNEVYDGRGHVRPTYPKGEQTKEV